MGQVFISYSWDSEEHKATVLSFVALLRERGFNATFDEAIMQNESATHFGKMMVYNIQSSQKVIIILTQEYKHKADNNDGGVGIEYGYIIDDINKEKDKYILVSFQKLDSKVINTILPFGFGSRDIIDLTVDQENGFEKLFSKLNSQPIFKLPPVAATKPIIKEKEISKFNLTDSKEENQESHDYHDVLLFDKPTKLFDYRLSQAFPGARGIQWFNNPKEIIKRLEVLLRCPLEIKGKNKPIWWFRGYRSLHIEKCNFTNEEKYLMNNMECLVDKICVYRSSRYDRSFVYVELKGESPIGIYKHDQDYNFRMMKDCGYVNEEYGIYKGELITREEYDDGAKFINNKLVNFNDDELDLRVRFLSKYNFIICAIFNPINSNEADVFFETYLKDMLDNIGSIEEVVKFVEKLPRHRNDH